MDEPYKFDFLTLTQSWYHMMLFYYSIRLDIAVGVLRDCEPERWPMYWYRNMWLDIECAGWLIAAYAGRQTVQAPVALGWTELINARDHRELAMVIQQAERLNRDSLDSFRTLLPFWQHNHSWPSFGMDNTWWLYPLREYNNFEELHSPGKTFKRAFNYFNGMWPRLGSPLHHNVNFPCSILTDGFHAELQRSLNQLKETEGEMLEAWQQVQSLTQLNPDAP